MRVEGCGLRVRRAADLSESRSGEGQVRRDSGVEVERTRMTQRDTESRDGEGIHKPQWDGEPSKQELIKIG